MVLWYISQILHNLQFHFSDDLESKLLTDQIQQYFFLD